MSNVICFKWLGAFVLFYDICVVSELVKYYEFKSISEVVFCTCSVYKSYDKL